MLSPSRINNGSREKGRVHISTPHKSPGGNKVSPRDDMHRVKNTALQPSRGWRQTGLSPILTDFAINVSSPVGTLCQVQMGILLLLNHQLILFWRLLCMFILLCNLKGGVAVISSCNSKKILAGSLKVPEMTTGCLQNFPGLNLGKVFVCLQRQHEGENFGRGHISHSLQLQKVSPTV